MTEQLLQYIWQFRYFNVSSLETSEGLPLQVVKPGVLNSNQGPDFLEAQVRIGPTLWAGNIEIHVRSSEWKRHGHDNDSNYSNIILHVVWEDDLPSATAFPTLVLRDRISRLLLDQYENLMQSSQFIPCQSRIHSVPSIIWENWKQRLLVERLQQRTLQVQALLGSNQQHWEETFWWMLARNLGQTTNTEAFEKIARSLPVTLLARHRNSLLQLEALLLGQAGLLEKAFEESYPVMLQKEYRFLRQKYRLPRLFVPVHFLRMRPANFPTVRLAQLAAIIQQSHQLFSRIREEADLRKVQSWLNVTANDYWHYHYNFDESSAYKEKRLGKQMIQNILVNSIVPILFAYGHLNQQPLFIDRALAWMELLDAEKNSITAGFEKLGLVTRSSFDSQALIQMKHHYCNYKLCLRCSVGAYLLNDHQR